MTFKTFGKSDNPTLILIHGMLTPWQIFLPHIEYFSKQYHVIIPIIDSHDPEHLSPFTSIDEQAGQIQDYLALNSIDSVQAVCGLSLGGIIAFRLYSNNQGCIKKLVIDGGPLCAYPPIVAKAMANNYIKILEGSRNRCPKTLKNYEKHFLPVHLLDDYLAIADTIDNNSVTQIMNQTALNAITVSQLRQQEHVLFLYGTALNETLSKRSAKLLKKRFPGIKTVCFKGDKHCYKAIYQPLQWCEVVKKHIEN